MDDEQQPHPHARRAGGRAAKRAARSARIGVSMPFITRRIGLYEVLDEDGLALIERNADAILAEIGIDFRDDAEALDLFRNAGCDVKGERVHFPRGLARRLVQATAPREFTQHARNPARSVVIPGMRTKKFPAGEYQIGCALIIGQRKESTDKKTSLNSALRDFNVSV